LRSKKEEEVKHVAIKLFMTGLILILVIEFVGCYSPKETGEAPPEAKKVTKGLIAYFPFSGNANDEISDENNGTVNGAVLTKDRFNKANCAYKFDGENDYISIPLNINPDEMPKLTLVAWVKPDDISPIKQVISHDNTGYDRSLCIDRRGGGEGWSAFIGSGAVLGYHPVKKGKWVLLSVAYNQADSIVKTLVLTHPLDNSSPVLSMISASITVFLPKKKSELFIKKEVGQGIKGNRLFGSTSSLKYEVHQLSSYKL
jgi:hypothetical protein